MADDITLTVRVRDMTRGDFNRLDQQLDRMRRDLRGVARDTESAGMHSKRLGNDLDDLGKQFKKMEETGKLSRRGLTEMKGKLDAMSQSALNAARSGEITNEKFHSLNSEIGRMRGQLTHLGRGLDDTTRQTRRMGDQTRTTVRSVNGMVRSVNHVTTATRGNVRYINRTTQSFRQLGDQMNKVSGNGAFAGGVFSNLRQKLIGTAVVLVASLLPTIGALSPMLFGLVGVGGAAALAFSSMKKEAAKLAPQFKVLQKTANAVIMPKFKSAMTDMKNVLKELNPVVKVGGDAFGTFVQKASKAMASPAFQGTLLKNVKMGSKWFLDFAKSIGTFTESFMDFGTKSQKSLDAWQELLGGFLDTGLPDMFKNMESGISGSSDFLSGLAYLINGSLLPSLGKLAAAFMDTFGPALEASLHTIGILFNGVVDIVAASMEGMKPAAVAITDFINAVNGVLTIGMSVAGSFAKSMAGAMVDTIGALTGHSFDTDKMLSSFSAFSDFVTEHQTQIRSAMTQIASAVISMVQAIVAVLPLVVNGFRIMMTGVVAAVGIMVNMLANTMGRIPGSIGKPFRDLKKTYDENAGDFINALNTMSSGINNFTAAAGPSLGRAKLTLNVDQAKESLKSITAQLNDPKLDKTHKARLEVEKEQAVRALAKAQSDLDSYDHKTARARVEANASPFFNTMGSVRAARIPKKTGQVVAATGGFWASVRGLIGRTLGTSYINVQKRYVEEHASPNLFSANGNIFKFFANGGENHQAQIAPAGSMRIWAEPETGGEAYIPLARNKRSRSRDIASTTVEKLGGSVEWYAKGGLSKKQKAAKAQASAEKSARSSAVGELTISHFGKMAGYKNDEFKNQLGLPDALGGLVSSLNHWRSVILKSTHGGLEKSLLKQLDKAGKKLIGYEKSLTKVTSELDKAKTKLSDLKQAAASLRDSVKSGVMSATDITRNSSNDKNLTVADLMSTMREGKDQSTAFASALKQLQAKGVSKDIISQIAQAGISGGGLETAGTLLTASSSEIKTMNDMQSQINKAASAAGNTAADAMYAAGIKAAEGLVAGLTKKKKSIEKAMMDIAKSMEKAIKKALKIKSPSRVMQEVGHYTAEGFAVGVKKNPNAGNAWTSMLTPSPAAASRLPSYASSGSSSGGSTTIAVYVGQKHIDDIVLDSSRRVVRTRGGNVQAVLGR